jgi:predicted phosphodiesterase
LIAVGDTGTGKEEQFEVAQGMAKVCEESGCDLVLLLGDNFYPDGVNSIEDTQFNTKFEQVYQKINKPFFAVLGNHDVKQDVLSQLVYSLKSSTWRMPNYEYSFNTAEARFYGLNTNCPFSSNRLRKKINQSDAELEINAAKRPWTIAFGHHSIYSNGTHGDVDLITRSYWNWFLEGRVDLYLAGHNHNLAHLQSETSATDYVISGAGGAHYRSASEREKLNKSVALNKYTYNDTGFVWLDISSEKLQIRFHDSSGKVIYEYSKTR